MTRQQPTANNNNNNNNNNDMLKELKDSLEKSKKSLKKESIRVVSGDEGVGSAEESNSSRRVNSSLLSSTGNSSQPIPAMLSDQSSEDDSVYSEDEETLKALKMLPDNLQETLKEKSADSLNQGYGVNGMWKKSGIVGLAACTLKQQNDSIINALFSSSHSVTGSAVNRFTNMIAMASSVLRRSSGGNGNADSRNADSNSSSDADSPSFSTVGFPFTKEIATVAIDSLKARDGDPDYFPPTVNDYGSDEDDIFSSLNQQQNRTQPPRPDSNEDEDWFEATGWNDGAAAKNHPNNRPPSEKSSSSAVQTSQVFEVMQPDVKKPMQVCYSGNLGIVPKSPINDAMCEALAVYVEGRNVAEAANGKDFQENIAKEKIFVASIAKEKVAHDELVKQMDMLAYAKDLKDLTKDFRKNLDKPAAAAPVKEKGPQTTVNAPNEDASSSSSSKGLTVKERMIKETAERILKEKMANKGGVEKLAEKLAREASERVKAEAQAKPAPAAKAKAKEPVSKSKPTAAAAGNLKGKLKEAVNAKIKAACAAAPKSKDSAASSHACATSKSKLQLAYEKEREEERKKLETFWSTLKPEQKKQLLVVDRETILKRFSETRKDRCSCETCVKLRDFMNREIEEMHSVYLTDINQRIKTKEFLKQKDANLFPSLYLSNSSSSTDAGKSPAKDSSLVPSSIPFASQHAVRIGDDFIRNDCKRIFDALERLATKKLKQKPHQPKKRKSGTGNSCSNIFCSENGHCGDDDDHQCEDEDEYDDGEDDEDYEEEECECGAIHRRSKNDKNAGSEGEDEDFNERYQYRHHGEVKGDEDNSSCHYEYSDEEDDEYSDGEYEDGDSEELDENDDQFDLNESIKIFGSLTEKLFEQRLINAYREKVAFEKQQELLAEEEEEERRNRERELNKQQSKLKKKERQKMQKQQKQEQKRLKELERKQQEELARQEKERQKEEQRKRQKELEEAKERELRELKERERDRERELQQQQEAANAAAAAVAASKKKQKKKKKSATSTDSAATPAEAGTESNVVLDGLAAKVSSKLKNLPDEDVETVVSADTDRNPTPSQSETVVVQSEPQPNPLLMLLKNGPAAQPLDEGLMPNMPYGYGSVPGYHPMPGYANPYNMPFYGAAAPVVMMNAANNSGPAPPPPPGFEGPTSSSNAPPAMIPLNTPSLSSKNVSGNASPLNLAGAGSSLFGSPAPAIIDQPINQFNQHHHQPHHHHQPQLHLNSQFNHFTNPPNRVESRNSNNLVDCIATGQPFVSPKVVDSKISLQPQSGSAMFDLGIGAGRNLFGSTLPEASTMKSKVAQATANKLKKSSASTFPDIDLGSHLGSDLLASLDQPDQPGTLGDAFNFSPLDQPFPAASNSEPNPNPWLNSFGSSQSQQGDKQYRSPW